MADYIPRNTDNKPLNRYAELEQMWGELYGDSNVDYPGYSEDLYDSLYSVKTANKLPEGSLSGVQNKNIAAMRPTPERYGSESIDQEAQRSTWAKEQPKYAPMQPIYKPEQEVNAPGQVPVQVNESVQGVTRYAPTQGMRKTRPDLTDEQMAINKAAFQEMHPSYQDQAHDKYGAQRSTPMSRGRNAAGYFNPNNMNDLNMRNASMGLINMADTTEVQRMGLGAKPQVQQPDTRRQDYINRVANKPLPQRDMRPEQSTIRQAELQNNQLQHRTNQVSQLTKYDEQPDYNVTLQRTAQKPKEITNGFF